MKWIFFYEDKRDEPEFEIETEFAIPEQAYEKAYEMWGPQIESMYYCIKPENHE